MAAPDYYSTALEWSDEDDDGDAEDDEWEGEEPDPTAIVYCAESFEAFLCRFWLENEISAAHCLKSPMPHGAREYLEQYRRQCITAGARA